LGQAQTRKHQYKHIAAVLLAYSLLVTEQKKRGYKNPEEAARALKQSLFNALMKYLLSLTRNTSIRSNLLIN